MFRVHLHCVYGILNDAVSILRYLGSSRMGAAPEVIPNLMKWWVFCGQMTLRTMLAVALLLVGPPMPDRTKRDTLVYQVGG